MSHLAVELKDVSRFFSARFALRQINLQVQKKERVLIKGPNGAGKTSLLRILATLLRPSSGEVFHFGISTGQNLEKIRKKTGAVFNESFLYPDLSVEENLSLYAHLYSMDAPKAKIMSWLEKLEIKNLQEERVRYLSKGELQKVSIIRSLLHDPELLIWDEPTAGLDKNTQNLVGDLVKSLRDCTVICASHNDSCEAWTNQTLHLEKGALS